MMTTAADTVESHPKAEVCVTVTVAAPGAPHNTLMEEPVVDPMMEPPVTAHEYECPEVAVME